MNTMKRFAAIFLVFWVFLEGGENGSYQTKQVDINQSLCAKPPQVKHEICDKFELHYEMLHHSSSSKLTGKVNAIIETYVNEFKKTMVTPHGEELSSRQEYESARQYEYILSIKIYALTSEVLALEIYDFSYTGGAHGNYSTTYDNYNLATGAKINIADFVAKNPTIAKEAERSYRREYKIAPDLPLSKSEISWFEDLFLPSSNCAITQKSLHCGYLPYERTPYSSGETSYDLLYEKLSDKERQSLQDTIKRVK